MSEHEALIRRVLGGNYLPLVLTRLTIDEDAGATANANVKLKEGDTVVEVDGSGVGVVDAIYNGLLARYSREYPSLKTIQIVGFQVSADMGSKKRHDGVDAVGKVSLDVTNSDGRHFTFTDASRSVLTSSARAVLACVEYFVNAERAFLTLHNARRDAAARGREDLVSRYTAELAEIVEATSYVDVVKRDTNGDP